MNVVIIIFMKRSKEFCDNQSKRLKGRVITWGDKISSALKGRHMSEEQKEKTRQTMLKRKIHQGSDNPAWAGGMMSLNRKVKKLNQYKQWRKAIFERDNYTCQACGQYGGKLEAHHIIAFSVILRKIIKEVGEDKAYEHAKLYSLLWNINNGQTLCIKCHKLTDNYGRLKL